ncbi:hypothetical protein JW911_00125 [Candidatus Peregrinibacteria bacterium]|nr:hypothetical protein [Candidatus Peregrinibacteria bacterium]
MSDVIKKIILFFTPYVNLFEWKVDLFFKHIKSTDSIFTIKRKLLELMQKNLIIVNIWMEKKYKGYIYLTKKARRKMYTDTLKIVEKFNKFRAENPIEKISIDIPPANLEKVILLAQICEFLKPGKYYEYIETSSFGKLLRDPDKQKLEGDCNQIVTLYTYLYSTKFPLEDLQIKLLPEHVCLHFHGIDIEATSGELTKYEKFDHILPVTEIISTNLLDLTDFREDTQKISEHVFVKSSQLAYAISSLREIVSKNLNIAYHNLGIAALNTNNYETAVFYLSKTDDKESLKIAYHNASVYFLNQKNYTKAEFYADKTGNFDFKNEIKKSAAAEEYNNLAKKVANIKTIEQAKQHKYTYQKMLDLAQKIGDESLINNVRDILNKL